MNKQYWLMKSEPDVFSIDDLKKEKKSLWDGVRNYQARNFMRDAMKVGDEVLFYHSNAKPSGIAGLAEVSRTGVVDHTALDPKSEYFAPKATKENPIWFCVEVKFKKKFPRLISLEELKSEKKLKDMLVVKKGQRLSIQPVTAKDFKFVSAMGEKD